MSRLAILLLSAAVVSGCAAVGPDLEAPTPPELSARPFLGGSSSAYAAADLPDDWWRLYEDPQLEHHVRQALDANRDVAVAAANLRRTRAALREVRTLAQPQTRTSAGGVYGQEPGGDAAVELGAGVDISYEVDLFGRIRRLVEASRAEADAAAAVLDVVRVTVAAETARAYVNACAATNQIGVARASLAIQDRTAELSRRRQEAGGGTRLDVARARALRERTAATVPLFEAERDSAIFRLATLTGQAPSALPPATFTCRDVPRLRAPIPIGDGAGLLRRRPDIRQAERELAAATARVGVAQADLYPRVALGGGLGVGGVLDDGAPGDALRFGIGPLISWSFPNLGGARARVRQAEASAEGALASFDGVVLRALEETETALVRYGRELDRREALVAARGQARQAAELARMRFVAGADSSLSVLDAERTLTEIEAALAQSDAAVANYQITVFKALGGGWRQTAPNGSIRPESGA